MHIISAVKWSPRSENYFTRDTNNLKTCTRSFFRFFAKVLLNWSKPWLLITFILNLAVTFRPSIGFLASFECIRKFFLCTRWRCDVHLKRDVPMKFVEGILNGALWCLFFYYYYRGPWGLQVRSRRGVWMPRADPRLCGAQDKINFCFVIIWKII